jgi:glycosyltransferase involved in cell wall biosynthesis
MRVRYDDRIFTMQRRGGISRYFVELIREFRDDPALGVTPQIDWRWTTNAHAIEAGLGTPLRIPGGSRGRIVRVANRLAELGSRGPDLRHDTYYGPVIRAGREAPPLVVTIYDMTPELLPEHFGGSNPHANKRAYVDQAALVLCISESTRRDLLRLYGSIAAPTVVTHLAVSPRFAPGAVRPAWAPPRYVLFLGVRSGYKDFPVALEAFAAVASNHPATSLVAVGGGPFTTDETATIGRWGLDGRVVQRDATDDELPGVFGAATAFVFPSRYEGFGLPTLEAMACGTPTVLADSSSNPEVGGTAALYFPPGDQAALAVQLERLLTDAAFAAERSAAGLAQAGRFSWRRTAEATADAYRLVGDSGRSRPGR